MKLCKSLLLVLFAIISNVNFSQQDTLRYWVQFTDKNNSIFDVNNPLDFLSQKAIDRRGKRNISITDQDFPVNQNYIDSILSKPIVWMHNQSRWFNAVTISCGDTISLQAIQNLPFVQQIEKVKSFYKPMEDHKLESIAVDKSFESYSVNAHYPYGKTYEQLHLHRIEYLHELGFKGQEMVIAVIDAGFLNVDKMEGLSHLFENGNVLSTKDFVAHDGDVYQDHYHGAAVLSIIASDIPGVYQGSAIKAKFHLLRSEDADAEYRMEEDNWISAAEYADSAGADLINTSLGYTTFDDSLQNHSYADLDGQTTRIAIGSNIAFSKGMLLCSSAGNSGSNSWGYISTPADADSIMTIGAVDSNGRYAPFSSFGPASDGGLKPNVMSVGWNTYFESPYNSEIAQGNGTSFSSPMFTGMAACLWQALPDLSHTELKNLIESHSSRSNAPDTLFGYGVPDFYQAYKSQNGLTFTYGSKLKLLELYPNPLMETGDLTLMLLSPEDQDIQIELFNTIGQKVESFSIAILEGRNKVSLNYRDWVAGGYVIVLTDSSGEKVSSKVTVY
ncbi:MAG: serine protease AprX [Parvicella sp.]|jgi:serine protease AprX